MKAIFLFVSVLLLTSLFHAPSFAIMKGEAVPEEHALRSKVAMIVLGRRSDGRSASICTGTRIAKRFILTAAHCLMDSQNRQKMRQAFGIQVHFSDYIGDNEDGDYIDHGGLTVFAHSIRVHPRFKWENDARKMRASDIGLILLDEILVDETVDPSPVILYNNQFRLRAGDQVTVAGYGGAEVAPERANRTLKTFATRVLNPMNGVNGMIEFFMGISRSGEIIGGMAGGDSGGPALLVRDGKTYLIGVASGYKTPGVTFPGSYENVSQYTRWIQETMAEMLRSSSNQN